MLLLNAFVKWRWVGAARREIACPTQGAAHPRQDLFIRRLFFCGRPVNRRLAGLTVLLVLLALLPWWRNHTYLNDLYDYGLVMAGVGRIDAGERPYRDFVTPIQTGVFLFNGWSEALTGTSYRGMTRGNAVLIVGGLLALAAVLSRRFSPVVALLVAAAVTWSTNSQHTIIWYNGMGVLLLALVAWAGALAPVLRREDASWNAVLGAALVLGGINKISFQMIAVAFAFGWALRAALNRKASVRRVVVTCAYILACGVAFPVLIEMAWTGASFATWWHNVVSLPASGRSADLPSILKLEFFLNHGHNYYGRLAVPFVGLLGVILTLLVVGIGWLRMPTRESRVECALLAAAGLLAMGGGIGLLATNQDIAYISFAGWLVLLVALWLGFGLETRGPWLNAALAAPIVLIGLFAWQAAWVGQRALWGYSPAPRAAYVKGETAGEAFAYLKGTRIPPELATSLRDLASWRSVLPADDRPAIYYSGGTEWLERVWPNHKVPGLPLWFAQGTNFGPGEQAVLDSALGPDGAYRRAIVSIARDVWFGGTEGVLKRGYSRQLIGPVLFAYQRVNSEGVSIHPLEFIAEHGGNLDSNLLASTMGSRLASEGRQFLGVRTGRGEMTLTVPTYRLRGDAVLLRAAGAPDGDLHADFVITALRADEPPLDLWVQRVTLPAGQTELFFPYELGGGAMPLRFAVTIPPGYGDMLTAGWRNPTIQHAMETSEEPPRIHLNSLSFTELNEDAMAAVLPGAWRPKRMIARGGRLASEGYTLAPGGELWVRAGSVVSSFVGTGRLVVVDGKVESPLVRAFYYKGGRLEMTSQESAGEAGRLDFRVWSAEPDGWLVLSVDENVNAASVLLKVTQVDMVP